MATLEDLTMTTNQIIIGYLAISLINPKGETNIWQLNEIIKPEDITEDFADEIISKLPEDTVEQLKVLAQADYQTKGKRLIFWRRKNDL